jgi:hypothetical protein
MKPALLIVAHLPDALNRRLRDAFGCHEFAQRFCCNKAGRYDERRNPDLLRRETEGEKALMWVGKRQMQVDFWRAILSVQRRTMSGASANSLLCTLSRCARIAFFAARASRFRIASPICLWSAFIAKGMFSSA